MLREKLAHGVAKAGDKADHAVGGHVVVPDWVSGISGCPRRRRVVLHRIYKF